MSISEQNRELSLQAPPFSPLLTDFLNRYYQAVEETAELHPREPKIWDWMNRVVRILSFEGIPSRWEEEFYSTQVVGIILCIIIDDIADLVSDEAFVDLALEIMKEGEIQKIPSHLSSFHSFLKLGHEIWLFLQKRFKSWPQYDLVAPYLHRAYDAYWKSLRDSAEFNRKLGRRDSPAKVTFADYFQKVKAGAYSHQFGLVSLLVMDDLGERDLDEIDEMLRLAEGFVVMGNWLATWKGEIPDRDFTSGVVVWALDRGVVEERDLFELRAERIIEKIEDSPYRQDFERRLEGILSQVEENYLHLNSVDVGAYIESLRLLLRYQLEHAQILKYAEEN